MKGCNLVLHGTGGTEAARCVVVMSVVLPAAGNCRPHSAWGQVEPSAGEAAHFDGAGSCSPAS